MLHFDDGGHDHHELHWGGTKAAIKMLQRCNLFSCLPFSLPVNPPSYLVHESYGWRLERVLLGQLHPDLPDASLVWRSLGTEELDDELVQAPEDGDLVLGLDQLDDVGVHATLPGRGRRHRGRGWW